MVKVLLLSTILSTGMTTTTTFDNIETCMNYRDDLITQKNIETSCVYADQEPKAEIDFLAEKLSRKLLIVFDAKLTQVLNEYLRGK
jgi:hypothetical protein